MLNDEERGDLHRMALTELWELSLQTGAMGTMPPPLPLLLLRTLLGWTNGGPEVPGYADMDRNGQVRNWHKRDHQKLGGA